MLNDTHSRLRWDHRPAVHVAGHDGEGEWGGEGKQRNWPTIEGPGVHTENLDPGGKARNHFGKME